MIKWEELDDTLSIAETKEEEVKLYLMADTTLEGSNSKSDEEVNINNRETDAILSHKCIG